MDEWMDKLMIEWIKIKLDDGAQCKGIQRLHKTIDYTMSKWINDVHD